MITDKLKLRRYEEYEETYLNFSADHDFKANIFCAISLALIDVALAIHLFVVWLGKTNYSYDSIELRFIMTSMVLYAIPVIVCAFEKFKKPYHKHLLLGFMMLGSTVIFAVMGEDGGEFILIPMFVAGIYYSERMCLASYIHLVMITIADEFVFFWLDINFIHYYGLSWDIDLLILNYILPELLYLTVVFIFSLYTMKNGRRLLKNLLLIGTKSAKKEAELETCTEVQKSAITKDFNLAPNGEFSISAGIEFAYETCGDFYDMFVTRDGKLVALIADVSDKGLAAAMYMMSARNTIRSLFNFSTDITDIMEKTNSILCETSDKQFVTMFLLCVDIKTGEGSFVNAGHNYPLLLSANEPTRRLETEPQFFLGAFEDAKYVSYDITLRKGDTICMYTDGITDSIDSGSQVFGEEHLIPALEAVREKTVDEIKDALLQEVAEFADDSKFIDDRTILVLRWN